MFEKYNKYDNELFENDYTLNIQDFQYNMLRLTYIKGQFIAQHDLLK